jgi:hypothetical protein
VCPRIRDSQHFLQAEGGVNLVLGHKPVIELMTGIKAAALRAVVRAASAIIDWRRSGSI